MLVFFITVIYSYLLGSIPTAYIIAKLFYRQDLTVKGSGNIGTLNFLRVTRTKSVAAIILMVDTFKGFLAVWLTDYYGQSDLLLISALAVVLGHIYPIWLGGHGGRGLATLAGVMIFLNPVMVALWWLVFAVIYLIIKKYIIGGMMALFVINIITALTDPQTFLILSVNSLLVMLKYVPRVRQEMNEIIKKGE